MIDDGMTSLAVDDEGNEDYFVMETEMQRQTQKKWEVGFG